MYTLKYVRSRSCYAAESYASLYVATQDLAELETRH